MNPSIRFNWGNALAYLQTNPFGNPWPDGATFAKVAWHQLPDGNGLVRTGAFQKVEFMIKDSKRFADSGGWGYAVFDYDTKSDRFMPGTLADKPPQGNDAKCGFACHTRVKTRDYVFTDYGPR